MATVGGDGGGAGRFRVDCLGPATIPSPLSRFDASMPHPETGAGIRFVDEADRLAYDPHLKALGSFLKDGATPDAFEVAGPRAKLFFNPPKTRAAIVTCGGLCPGINAVVRALVMQLWYRYNCRDILGIRYGYGGLGHDADPPLVLDPETVAAIHTLGGTMLGTSRGTPPTAELVDSLVRHEIDVLFTIGGDGTMRGAAALHDEIAKRGLEIAVVGVPKTIDNDIPFVRRTFGFDTAVAVATESVHAAHVEATGVPFGIGLVKLMGRHAGYIAANAALAAGVANYVLVPEVPFGLDGPGGLLDVLERRLEMRRHAVIVVAEGAGQYFFKNDKGAADASGNAKLGDIGVYLKERINAHFAGKPNEVTLKYIDPSYLIRSSQANPTDQLYCARLAQDAVHAAMAGKSGLLIGYWHGQMTHVPTRTLSGATQRINPRGELWLNVLESTGQPARIGKAP
jgi:6-phosphofructokinase 1